MPSKRVIPQVNPNWKQHQGPHVIEFVEDINVRRKKRNDRRKTLFLKAHELSILSGGSVFVMFKDDNDQTWSFASNEDLWERYCTTGLKQESGEKRCDKHSQIISINRDGKTATTIHRRVTIPTPSRTTEFNLSYTDVSNLSRIPVQSSTVFVNEVTDHLDTEVTFELDIQTDVRSPNPTEENHFETFSLIQQSPVILQNITDHLPATQTFPLSIPQPQQSLYNLAATSDETKQFSNLTTSTDMNRFINSASGFPQLTKDVQLDMQDSLRMPDDLVLQAYPQPQDHIESAHSNLPVGGHIESQQESHIESNHMISQEDHTKTASISAQATDHNKSGHMEQQTVEHNDIETTTMLTSSSVSVANSTTLASSNTGTVVATTVEHNDIETTSLITSSSVSVANSTTIASPNTGTVVATRPTASAASDEALQDIERHLNGETPSTFDIVVDSITLSPEGNVTEPGTPVANALDNPSGQDLPTFNAVGDKVIEKAVTENNKGPSEGKKITVGRFYSKAPKILVKRLQGPPSPKVVRKSRRSSTLSEPMRAILKTLKKKNKV